MKASEKAYYILTCGRAYGRTEAMIKGAENVKDAIIIAASEAQAKHIRQRTKTAVFSLQDLEKLKGLHNPIVIDHFAMQVLWDEREEEFKRQLTEIKK
jgi:hypothetical protein